jgi:hypothetical protein
MTFKEEVQRQRAGLAVLLPVAPTIALKQTVLTSAAAAGGAAAVAGAGAAGTGGLFAALGAQSLTAKALITLTVAGGGAGAAVLSADSGRLAPAEADGAREAVVALRDRAGRVAAARAYDRAVAHAPTAGTVHLRPSRTAGPDDAARRDGSAPGHAKGHGKAKGRHKAKGRANGKGFGVTGRHPGHGKPAFGPPGRQHTPPGQAKKVDTPGAVPGPRPGAGAGSPAAAERPAVTDRQGPKLTVQKKVQRVRTPKQVTAPSVPSVPRGRGVPGVPPKRAGVHDRGKHTGDPRGKAVGDRPKPVGDPAGVLPDLG